MLGIYPQYRWEIMGNHHIELRYAFVEVLLLQKYARVGYQTSFVFRILRFDNSWRTWSDPGSSVQLVG